MLNWALQVFALESWNLSMERGSGLMRAKKKSRNLGSGMEKRKWGLICLMQTLQHLHKFVYFEWYDFGEFNFFKTLKSLSFVTK